MKLFGSSVITATRRSCAQTGKSVLGDSPTCRAASVTSSFVKRAQYWRPGCLVCSGSETREGCWDAICEPCEQRQDEYFVFCDACDSNWCKGCGTAPEISYCSTNVTPHCAMTAIKEDPRSAALAIDMILRQVQYALRLNATIFTARRAMIRWHKCTFGTNDWESDETSSGDLHHLGETITPSSTGGTSGYTGSPSTASIVSTVPTPPCT